MGRVTTRRAKIGVTNWQLLEDLLSHFKHYGFAFFSQGEVDHLGQPLPQRIIITQAAYRTPYACHRKVFARRHIYQPETPDSEKTDGKHDALLICGDNKAARELIASSDGKIRIVFECKAQNGSGSVDEKFPYIMRCFIQSTVPNWLVILGGNFWTKTQRDRGDRGPAAVRALKADAQRCSNIERKLTVLLRAEVPDWIRLTWGRAQ